MATRITAPPGDSPSRPPAVFRELKRVAWIRGGALGDLLVGLASLVEMASFFPSARVTVVGPRAWLEILSPALFPFVERIAVVERKSTRARLFERGGKRWQASDPRGVAAGVSLVSVLASCDGMVNTNIDSLRYGFAGLRARVPVRVGSAPPPWTWIYTHGAPFFGKDPLVHERDSALLLLEQASAAPARHFQSVARHRERLAEILAASPLVAKWRELGLPAAKPVDPAAGRALTGRPPGTYALFNPTASRREKTWPSERMRALIETTRATLAASGVVPVVIGAPHETDWLREVAGDDLAIAQPRDLGALQDVVAGARALVANASSMQFIAGTTQTPTLTIFGRGQPVIWGPVGRHDRFVRAKFSGADRGQTFAGLEEEARIYRTIEVAEVAREFQILLVETEKRVT